MEILLGNDWFKITYALLSDKRYKRAHKDLGIQSLGIIVFIWLKLRQEKNYRYEFNDLDLLADEANVSVPIFTTIINSYGLFSIVEINDIKYIESTVLNHWMSGYDKKVIQNKNAGQISAQKRKKEKEKRVKQLSLNNSTQHMLNICNTEREVEEEITTTTIYNNKNFLEVANLYGISEDDYKDEIQSFIDFNNHNEKRLTITNWKKWCLRYQEHELKRLKENKRQSK